MNTEVTMLAFACLLGLVQLLAAAHMSTSQRGFKWNLSARDEKRADLTGVAGRLDRAFKNFMETFVFFAAAVLMVTEMKTGNATTALGAQIYLVGRVVYVPVYAIGTPVLRTIVWFASTVG